MSRFNISLYVAFKFLLIATTTINAAHPSLPEKPNFIFVMTDDQGYAPIGAHGHPWIRTPNLDRMHGDSIRFDRFMVGSTCAPSRAGLMAGDYSIRNGVTHTIYERERLRLEAITLPEILKKAGYLNGYFGKWHLGDEGPYQPENRGFDESFIHGAGGIGQKFPGSCADVPGNTYFDPVFRHNGKFVKTKGYCTDVLFKATLGWIKSVKDKKQPFFAYLSPNAPHSPFIAPPEYQKYYEDLGFGSKPAGFYGMIEHIDMNIGVLMDKLEEWKLLESTVVIFTSDNGMTRGGSGLMGFEGQPQVELGRKQDGSVMMSYNAGMKGLKGTAHEGGVRVPFFVKWKGQINRGETREQVASYLDVLPTLADLAGLPILLSQKFKGRSLVPLLFDANSEWEERYLFEHVTRWPHKANPDDYKWQKYSVRSHRFRLVEDALYDMKNDPRQNQDVSTQFPEIVKRMKNAYEKFWNEARPLMINEDVPLAELRPYHFNYFKQEKAEGIPLWQEPVITMPSSYVPTTYPEKLPEKKKRRLRK